MGGCDRWIKHPDYYLTNDSASFLIGKTLFRVHRHFFARESQIFQDLFTAAAAEGPEIGTDQCPFTLSGVTPEEFAQFLWVWYGSEYSYQEQSKDRWVTILTLARRWEFPKIERLAVREIEALELAPAERISLYNEHSIEGEGLMSSYVELCKSPKLTKAEGDLIKMETLIKVLEARETALRKAVELGHESPTSASLEDGALRQLIKPLFEKGLNPPSDGSSTGSGAQASGLNGNHAHITRPGISTIFLRDPQVPNKRTQPVDEALFHSTNPAQASQTSDGSVHEETKEEPSAIKGENEEKLAQEAEKEKTEKEKAEKEKAEKEKAEKEKAEKAKQEREKEQKGGQNSSNNRSRNARGGR